MEERIKLLESKIAGSIEEYQGRRKRMYSVVRGFKYPIVVLTMLSTIILGIDLDKDWIVYQKNMALVLGAIVTALVTLKTFWNVDEYWIKNKAIELQLLSLNNSLEFERKGALTDDRVKDFFSQYQTIIGQREELWKITSDQGTKK